MRAAFLAIAAAGCIWGQQAGVTIGQAVDASLRNYPAIRVSREQAAAAAAGIQLARTAYLPRVDAFAQGNRATRNNVFGMLLPQSVIPQLSGPVIGSNNLGTAWGSAIGTLVTWEPFDFGQRRAGVAVAESARLQSEAAARRTEYEIAVAAADAFLTLAAAEASAARARAGVDRAETVERTIGALVKAELRPGADASRARAETAAARTQSIGAEQAVDVARAILAQYMGVEPRDIRISPPQSPAPANPPAVDLAANPIALEQNAAIEQAKQQLHALERSYFPRFYLQGAAYARGSGAEITGNNLGGLNGLAPNVQNYGLGFSVTFPVMDFAALRARETAQAATIRAQAARSQQIAAELRARFNVAAANLEGARRVAANTPVAVEAARMTLDQATARYQSGLGNINDVAEAQRLLTQSEIDDALARLAIWRGLLGVAAAAGDVRPFLVEAGR
jgi:outer membrane protein